MNPSGGRERLGLCHGIFTVKSLMCTPELPPELFGGAAPVADLPSGRKTRRTDSVGMTACRLSERLRRALA